MGSDDQILLEGVVTLQPLLKGWKVIEANQFMLSTNNHVQ